MPLSRVLRSFFIAPIGSVVVQALFLTFAEHLRPSGAAFVIVLLWVYVLSLAAGSVFALPFLLFVPRVRQPPFWLAALWGAGAACAFSVLLFGTASYSPPAWTGLALAGAASGVVYRITIR